MGWRISTKRLIFHVVAGNDRENVENLQGAVPVCVEGRAHGAGNQKGLQAEEADSFGLCDQLRSAPGRS